MGLVPTCPFLIINICIIIADTAVDIICILYMYSIYVVVVHQVSPIMYIAIGGFAISLFRMMMIVMAE